MKKLSILGLCLLAVASASAQRSLVKEVEGKSKGFNADFTNARKMLKPALDNAESKGDVLTWVVAGNIEFGEYDNLLGKKSVGQNVDDKVMAHDLLNGYNYYMTAFPLDSIPEVDKKGNPKLNKDGSQKIKTKYSKDMATKLAAHYNDYLIGGQALWDAKDYEGAYTAWDLYTTLPFNKSLGEYAPAAPADSSLAEINYFKGLAAWQAEKLELALNAFDEAARLGLKKTDLYDYAISVAAQSDNAPKVVSYAQAANKIFGDTTAKYLLILINDKINNQDYEAAMGMLTDALKLQPENAELYDVRGILYQQKGDLETARKDLEKAVALDPDYVKAQLDLGRVIYAQGATIDEASATLPQAEYNKVRAEQVDPLLKQAIPYLEVALKNDSTEAEARRLLRSLYYSLGDEANLKRVESM